MQALRLSVCLIAMLSSIVMGFYWKAMHGQFTSGYTRVDVPVASNSGYVESPGGGAVVSLTRDGKWIYEDRVIVGENELQTLLRKERDMLHGLGLWAKIRVRIPKDAPARHFLEINRIAVECGYEQMIVSVVSHERRLRTRLPGGGG